MAINELNAGSILGLSGSYWQTCTLHSGVKLDLFTAIGKDNLNPKEISQKLKVDEDGIIRLMNALCAIGLLIKKGDKYSNTDSSYTFLSKSSQEYIGYMIMHHYHLFQSWHKLDEAVKSGAPVRTTTSAGISDEDRENFLMGMFNNAMNLAPRIIPKIDLSGKQHLLDLGGGPGTYAIHFCLNNPNLSATVFDLPTTKPFAERTIKQFNLTDRINFIEGNFLQEKEISGKYDAAWLSHILHGEGPEDCEKIIQKTVAALKSNGMIMIHEFILNNTMDGPLFPALFSLNMLVGTKSGRSYSEEQLINMLEKAGVKKIRRISITTPNDSGIIQGVV